MKRIGACTPGCGACCTHLELEIHPVYLEHTDVRHWVELHGITLSQRGERAYANIPLACMALTPDRQCSLFGKPERPDLCGIWPFEPGNLADPEIAGVCTYSFEEEVA